jgi:hypothetical protein
MLLINLIADKHCARRTFMIALGIERTRAAKMPLIVQL